MDNKPAGLLSLTGKPDDTIEALMPENFLVDLKETEVLPIMYHQLLRPDIALKKELLLILGMAKKLKRKILVPILNDHEFAYPQFKELILLRTSLRRSLRQSSEYVLPFIWESRYFPFDAAKVNNGISFCGMNNKWRQPLLDAFSKDPILEANFLIRGQFWGGRPHDPELRDVFWNNLNANAFALAPRGAGNFSMRFYQALSIGRIPVLMDTDLVLPLPHLIDWESMIVLGKSPEDCVKKVISIWKEGKVLTLQKKCYDMYHQYLDHGNYLRYLLPSILNSMEKGSGGGGKWWNKFFAN